MQTSISPCDPPSSVLVHPLPLCICPWGFYHPELDQVSVKSIVSMHAAFAWPLEHAQTLALLHLHIYIIRKVSTWLLSLSPDKLKFLYIISWWTQVLISGTSIVTPVVADGASTEFFDSLRIEMRMEDGECQWKSEREERKKETSAESETVRLAIINHIRCWRRPRILATRQTLHLSSIPISFFC